MNKSVNYAHFHSAFISPGHLFDSRFLASCVTFQPQCRVPLGANHAVTYLLGVVKIHMFYIMLSLQPRIFLDVNALGQNSINVDVFVHNKNQESVINTFINNPTITLHHLLKQFSDVYSKLGGCLWESLF